MNIVMALMGSTEKQAAQRAARFAERAHAKVSGAAPEPPKEILAVAFRYKGAKAAAFRGNLGGTTEKTFVPIVILTGMEAFYFLPERYLLKGMI